MKNFYLRCILFLLLIISWRCSRDNGSVEILSLNASSSLIEAGGYLSLYCIAKDQDKDPLVYSWESSSGSFAVNNDSAVWTAPMEYGMYFISCRVTDNYGSSDVETVRIIVNASGSQLVSPNTYIMIIFDNSGSMDGTLSPLNTMATGEYTNPSSLRNTLQDFYATGETQNNGNLDKNTNGSNTYDKHVFLLQADSERTFKFLANKGTMYSTDGNFDLITRTGFSTEEGKDFENADNIIIFVFQDEAENGYHTSTFSNTDAPTSQYKSDIQNLRTSINSINTISELKYFGHIFHVEDDGNNPFKSFVKAVLEGLGNYSGSDGLSDSTIYTERISADYDLNDGDTEIYYKNMIINALANMGFILD